MITTGRSHPAELAATSCLSLALSLATVAVATAESGAAPQRLPAELGRVTWLDLDTALRRAADSGKPLLVLFQEVPGCSTCVKYGSNVLSHPLIVEAAEGYFEPALVYNNRSGRDAEWLKAFDEPAWNNPVVRFIDARRRDVVPRLAGNYTVGGLAMAMVTVLKSGAVEVPLYLQLLAEESHSRAAGVETATFEMHCFWEGELRLGRIPGVVGTRPGFMGKEEVVEVEFDPRQVSFDTLVKRAHGMACARRVFVRDAGQHDVAARHVPAGVVRSTQPMRPDKEPKYYLFKTPYQHVPMTPLQAIRVNDAIFNEQDPARFLSPRQLQLLAVVRGHPKAGWPPAAAVANLARAWMRAQAIADELDR